MCGIWVYLTKNKSIETNYAKIYSTFMKSRNRGPDRSHLVALNLKYNDIYIGFHRLSIMDTSTKGDQPFILEDEERIIYAVCNGEIYNFKHLVEKYNISTKSGSDCEVIPHIYKQTSIKNLAHELCSDEVSGEFACVIIDINKKTNNFVVHAMRDSFGIRPLFVSEDETSMCFSSELKSIIHENPTKLNKVKPATYVTYLGDTIHHGFIRKLEEYKYFDIHSIKPTVYELSEAKKIIRETFRRIVRERMIADRTIGFLLSGGVDSSLCVGEGAVYLKELNSTQKIITVCVGMDGATDEKYANLVAQFVDSNHYHVKKSEEDFIKCCESDIVYITESFDITTNRASTGQFLASLEAKKLGCIVLIIGDGSDELFGGYKYFHKAPSPEEYHQEILRLLDDIDDFDVRRADRCVTYNGLEARTPFLDHRFIKAVLSIDPVLRMPINGVEKWLLRESFKDMNIIPNEVLFRPKEAFSDGVSSMKRSWYQIFQEHIDKKISDTYNEDTQYNYHCMPRTKEAYYYREQFTKYFGTSSELAKTMPYFWLPKWVGEIFEPSARVLDVYKIKEDSELKEDKELKEEEIREANI